MRDPKTRLPEAWLIDDIMAIMVTNAADALMTADQRLGQILPSAAGILMSSAMNITQLADIQRSSFIQRLQNAHGPTATQMRQQARIDRLVQPREIGSCDVEARVTETTPKRFAKGWSLYDLPVVKTTFVPYFNGLYKTTGDSYLLVLRPRPTLSSWAAPSHLENAGEFDWATARSSFRIEASLNRYAIRLVLRQTNGSAVFLHLTLHSSRLQVHDIMVYDALEDAVYPGTPQHIDQEAVRVEMFNLLTDAGYPDDTIFFEPRKEDEAAAIQEAQAILTTSYAEFPFQKDTRSDFWAKPQYTEELDGEGNIAWTMRYEYPNDSYKMVFTGTDKDIPQTGVRGQDSSARPVTIDPLSLPSFMQAWKQARAAYLAELKLLAERGDGYVDYAVRYT